MLALAWPNLLAAQHTEVPPPTAYALKGVTVVQADGRKVENQTLVVRGAFIETLAAGAQIPADAKVLEGDSLMVYPGFIDAQGTASYEFPSAEFDRAQVRSWEPPRAAQGFMPHRRVVDFLKATGKDLGDQRKKGVVAAAVYPVDGLMPGRGAVLVFRKGAATPTELVHTPVLGPVMTLRGGIGYPSTLFGIQAFYRQTFEDAARMRLVASEYARDPRGLLPPPYDPDFEVVQEAMSGRVPTFVVANSAEDIRRILALTEQYGVKPIIVGGEEAWRVADLLKTRKVPVLVSLDFPKPRFWEPEGGRGSGADRALDPTELREKERLENIYANAGRLEAAGVQFALTSGGGSADLREGARKAIEYGLSEGAALRALTTTPAELLGLQATTRIETGRPATFVVTNGPLFGEDSRIVYTFVEGELEEGAPARRPAASGGAAAGARSSIDGTWSADLSSDAGSLSGTMTIRQSESSFTGSIPGTEIGDLSITNGTISGSRIEFQLVIQFGSETMRIPFSGTVEGTTLTATGSSPMGEVTIRARRTGGSGGAR